jgi:hypothetical protein
MVGAAVSGTGRDWRDWPDWPDCFVMTRSKTARVPITNLLLRLP